MYTNLADAMERVAVRAENIQNWDSLVVGLPATSGTNTEGLSQCRVVYAPSGGQAVEVGKRQWRSN